MNVTLAVKHYVTKMIESSGAGMKVLLMDRDTVRGPPLPGRRAGSRVLGEQSVAADR